MVLHEHVRDGGEGPVPWTRAQAGGVARSDDVVAPVVYPPESDPLSEDVHIWDTWILRNRDGSIATVDGYRVLFSLTAPADMLPGKRHDVATVRYFYAADGEQWQNGGPVFADDAVFGQRQWAGSALLDDGGTVTVFYTAAGQEGAEELTYEQRIAAASGGRIDTDDGFRIDGPWDHEILLEPDGEYYEREDQSRGMIYTFRDPWFFEDSATGRTYLLFEANTPVPADSDACDGDPALQEFNGSIGVAESPTGDPMDWELRAPLVDAVCVNQELERPHVVVRDGTYYLFFSSHDHTFAPGLDGVDGLYGFVADSLRGDYRPLNDSALVLTNPGNAAYQTYSWMAFPHGDEVLVQSFFNYYDLGGLTLDDVGHLPPDEQLRRFGGTLAPTVRLDVDGDRTRVRGTLGHGHIPTQAEELPPLTRVAEDTERIAEDRYGDRHSGGR
jgi:levansucrase